MKQLFENIICCKCNAGAGLNFEFAQKDERIGHLVRLVFIHNGVELVPDMLVCDPQNPSHKVPIVSALSHIQWTGGDRVSFGGHISPQNRAIFQEAVFTADEGLKIGAEFIVYEYAHFEQEYFQRIHSNKKLIKYQEQLEYGPYIGDFLNKGEPRGYFDFDLNLQPLNGVEAQELYFATSPNGKLHKRQISGSLPL